MTGAVAKALDTGRLKDKQPGCIPVYHVSRLSFGSCIPSSSIRSASMLLNEEVVPDRVIVRLWPGESGAHPDGYFVA